MQIEILCEIIRLKHVPVETRYCTEIPWRGVIVRWHPDCALMATSTPTHTRHGTHDTDVYLYVGYGLPFSMEHGCLSSVYLIALSRPPHTSQPRTSSLPGHAHACSYTRLEPALLGPTRALWMQPSPREPPRALGLAGARRLQLRQCELGGRVKGAP